MANILSRNSKSSLGICLTLDAFGTLYHPKKPIAVQYLEIARQCGLKADIQVDELEASFRKAFKDQSAKYPNYGKSKGMNAESWWYDVVYGAFHPLCRSQKMPASLAFTLFHHFSSRDAYALYPDVLPFFQTMRELRENYSDPKGPIILVGVVTNSDNRARTILQSLGLQVGHEGEHKPAYRPVKDIWEDGKQCKKEPQQQGGKLERMHASGIWFHSYNSKDDINFLITSYDTGSEKPSVRIFAKANDLAATLRMSRLEQSSKDEFLGDSPFKASMLQVRSLGMTQVHVGDDFEKDYQAAKNADRQALHLRRDKHAGDLKNYEISNLLELAAFIKLIADFNLAPIATNSK